jgi:uncharacterized phage protein (TIGR01671 family)
MTISEILEIENKTSDSEANKMKLQFRAWSKKDRQMYQVKAINFNNETVELNGAETYPIKDVELMQCTGLRDAEKKWIYEGDIIKTFTNAIIRYEEQMSHRYENEIGGGQYVTYFKENAPVYGRVEHYGKVERANNGTYYISGTALSVNAICNKVVGNIYENPELIGG